MPKGKSKGKGKGPAKKSNAASKAVQQSWWMVYGGVIDNHIYNTDSVAKKPGKKPGNPGGGGGGCLTAATYASTAAAEASGDNWCDGATITITGGPVYIYLEALAVSGYSGLIHKEPYGSGLGTISTSTAVRSAPEGDDPDDWVGWTDIGAGTKGVDYEHDTDGGLARFRDLNDTAGSQCNYAMSDQTIDSGDLEVFAIYDRVTLELTGNGLLANYGQLLSSAYVDPTTNCYVFLTGRKTQGASHWHVQAGDTYSQETATTRLTESRAFVYLKNGRWAVWFDDNAAPDIADTNTQNTASVLGLAKIQIIDGAAGTGVGTLKLGTTVIGRMTTA